MGAAESFLVGKIHRMTSRQDSAKKYFASALELDPFLWSAFEELCRLGEGFFLPVKKLYSAVSPFKPKLDPYNKLFGIMIMVCAHTQINILDLSGADTDTTDYLRNMASMAGIENDMRSLQLNSPTSEVANNASLMNTANRLQDAQQGREVPLSGLFESGRYGCGSPRTPTSLTSPAPRGMRHFYC